jgi:transcriptional regulator with XRE-family HTH domain
MVDPESRRSDQPHPAADLSSLGMAISTEATSLRTLPRLRERRLELGLSRLAAARRADVDPNWWFIREKGEACTADMESAVRVAEALDINFDEIFRPAFAWPPPDAPADIIPLRIAAQRRGTTPRTLSEWVAGGRLLAWEHPARKHSWYVSEVDVEQVQRERHRESPAVLAVLAGGLSPCGAPQCGDPDCQVTPGTCHAPDCSEPVQVARHTDRIRRMVKGMPMWFHSHACSKSARAEITRESVAAYAATPAGRADYAQRGAKYSAWSATEDGRATKARAVAKVRQLFDVTTVAGRERRRVAKRKSVEWAQSPEGRALAEQLRLERSRWVELVCRLCGETFEVPPRDADRKFCSRSHATIATIVPKLFRKAAIERLGLVGTAKRAALNRFVIGSEGGAAGRGKRKRSTTHDADVRRLFHAGHTDVAIAAEVFGSPAARNRVALILREHGLKR